MIIKKSIIILSCLIAMKAGAEANTAAHLFPINKYQPKNTSINFESSHAFNATNRTTTNQTITVCYKLITCFEYPVYMKISQQCDNYSLASAETISKDGHLFLTVNYPFNGATCSLQAITDVSGYVVSTNTDKTTFIIK